MREARTGRPLLDGAVLVAGAALILFGVAISPELLIELGPMRDSLSSPIAAVQRIAHLEISVVRIVFFMLGACLLAAWLAWPALQRTDLMRRIKSHSPAVPRPRWSVAAIVRWPLIVLLAGVLMTLIVTLVGPRVVDGPTFWILAKEDGIVEYSTAGMFLLAAAIAFAAARRAGTTADRIVLGLFSGAFVLCCGEEISWGQRLFEFSTPESMAGINVQGEVNLHNSFGYAADHVFILGILVYGFGLPVLAATFDTLHRLFDRCGIPIASPSLACGFLVVSLLHDWTVYELLPISALRMAEVRELLSGLGLVILMYEAFERVRGQNQTAIEH